MILLENRKRQRCIKSNEDKNYRFFGFDNSLEPSEDVLESKKRQKCRGSSCKEDRENDTSCRLSIDYDSIVLFAGLFDSCGGDDDDEILGMTYHPHNDDVESNKENERIVVVRKDVIQTRRPKRQVCLGCGDVRKVWKAPLTPCDNACGRNICGKCLVQQCRSKGPCNWSCLFCSSKSEK